MPENKTSCVPFRERMVFYNLMKETLIPIIQKELIRCPALEVPGDVKGYHGVFVGTGSAKKTGRQQVFLLDKHFYDTIKEKLPGRAKTNGNI